MVELEEFCQVMVRYQQGNSVQQELLEAFKVFDKDQNGLISIDEFKEVLKELGEPISHIHTILK